MSNDKPPRFDQYVDRAKKLIEEPQKLSELSRDAQEKLSNTGRSGGKFQAVREELALLIEFLKAYQKGTYRDVSTRSLVIVAAGVLYFLMPFDLVPDFILGLGLLDDAAVISYVIAAVRGELSNFRDSMAMRQHNQTEDGETIENSNEE